MTNTVDKILDQYPDLTHLERRLLELEAKMAGDIKAGHEIDEADARDMRDVLREQGAEYVSEIMGWPLDRVRPMLRAGVGDRAIAFDIEDGPHVTDLVLPLVLVTIELRQYVHDGRLTEQRVSEILQYIEDEIARRWPEPAMCSGTWQLNLPEGGEPLMLTAIQRAYEKAKA